MFKMVVLLNIFAQTVIFQDSLMNKSPKEQHIFEVTFATL